MQNREPQARRVPDARDIGAFDAPVLVCGGAYSNLEALEALFAEAGRLAVPSGRIIHTGDVVAYGADPQGCVDLLKTSGAHAIQGNVEAQLAANADDCACGYEAGTTCGTLALSWYDYANRRLGPAERRWMGELPEQLVFSLGGVRFRVVHGGVAVINRFIYATSPDEVFDEEFAMAGTAAVIAGHGGIPFTRALKDRLWHNSGALGLPANDGTPRVWYSLIAPRAGGGVQIGHRALTYDHERAAGKMRAVGLPEPYAAALVSGLLPAGNALPAEEQARTGRPIEARRLDWRPAPLRAAG